MVSLLSPWLMELYVHNTKELSSHDKTFLKGSPATFKLFYTSTLPRQAATSKQVQSLWSLGWRTTCTGWHSVRQFEIWSLLTRQWYPLPPPPVVNNMEWRFCWDQHMMMTMMMWSCRSVWCNVNMMIACYTCMHTYIVMSVLSGDAT